NAVELLIDGEAHYTAWLEAIRGARHRVLLENYIVRNDAVGRAFLDALSERARAGVFVAVLVDWMGCLGQSRGSFWAPLRAAGGHFRVFNPPRLGQSLGWVSRDHRKVLVVDGMHGFLSGVCISEKWLGDPSRRVPPCRDRPWRKSRRHLPTVGALPATGCRTSRACSAPPNPPARLRCG